MAYPHRPGHGRYTHTPPPPPPCTGPCCAPPARGRGGYQPARGRGGYQPAQYTHTPPPPPPFTRPCSAPPARGRGGYQRYGGDVAAGLAIGAVGAAGIMSGYGVPAYGGYQNLPIITGVVATGTEELAAEICHNNLFGFGDGDGFN